MGNIQTNDKGWDIADVHNIPPIKDTWSKGWHSVRHHFGINSFGINAVTKLEIGEVLTPEHDETKSRQQEVFYVAEGKSIFTLDGQEVEAPTGSLIAVQPHVKRSAKAAEVPNTILLMGAAAGEAYEIPSYEKIEEKS